MHIAPSEIDGTSLGLFHLEASLPEALKTILSWFGGLTAIVVGLTAVAYWLFQTFSQKWLETRFSERLESYRHQLSALLDRTTRLHAQEFEVLPNLWEKLSKAMGGAMNILSPLQLSGDISYAKDEELAAILEKSHLLEHEKQQVRDAGKFERSPLFHRFVMNHRFKGAVADWNDFNSYAVSKSIFLEPTLSARIRELGDMIYEGLDAHGWAQSDPSERKEARAAWEKLRTEGVKLRDEIEASVSARLRAATQA